MLVTGNDSLRCKLDVFFHEGTSKLHRKNTACFLVSVSSQLLLCFLLSFLAVFEICY